MIATTVVISVVSLALIAVNLDVVGDLGGEDLPSALCCYQIMTFANEVLGFHNWRLRTAYLSLADCYSRQGRGQEAVRAARNARRTVAQICGNESVDAAACDVSVAVYLCELEDYKGAETLLCSAVKTFDAAEGQYEGQEAEWLKNYRLVALSKLSDAYVGLNEAEKAEGCYQRLASLESERLRRLDWLWLLANSYLSRKLFDRAEECARHVIALEDSLSPQEKLEYRTSWGGPEILTEVYCKSNRLPAAFSLAEGGLKKANAGGDRLAKGNAHDLLGRVYMASGNFEGARDQFHQAAAYLGDVYPNAEAGYESMLSNKDAFPD